MKESQHVGISGSMFIKIKELESSSNVTFEFLHAIMINYDAIDGTNRIEFEN